MDAQRITIEDVAQRAGVTKSTVSNALNERPGVSEATRQRIRHIAAELGWQPSSAARSLSMQRSGMIGMVLARPARMLGVEPFFMEFISGIEDILATRDIGLVLEVASSFDAETAVYRRWWAGRRVDGVIIMDRSFEDPRIDAVRQIGIPAVFVTNHEESTGLTHVWTDDSQAMTDAVRYLIRLGHRQIARVAGNPAFRHIAARDDAMRRLLAEAGLSAPQIVSTDFSGELGAAATRALLTGQEPPTAVIYDNDVMAVAGLGVASELGVAVPEELSLLAWDDSALCEITRPPLSAMHRDVAAFGSTTAELLLQLIDGEPVDSREGPHAVLTPRGTTARPPSLG
ncbi:MAG TPA: LacI family DNA-binding transcriptional regulator [Gryllotalpicola sp.]